MRNRVSLVIIVKPKNQIFIDESHFKDQKNGGTGPKSPPHFEENLTPPYPKPKVTPPCSDKVPAHVCLEATWLAFKPHKTHQDCWPWRSKWRPCFLYECACLMGAELAYSSPYKSHMLWARKLKFLWVKGILYRNILECMASFPTAWILRYMRS